METIKREHDNWNISFFTENYRILKFNTLSTNLMLQVSSFYLVFEARHVFSDTLQNFQNIALHNTKILLDLRKILFLLISYF